MTQRVHLFLTDSTYPKSNAVNSCKFLQTPALVKNKSVPFPSPPLHPTPSPLHPIFTSHHLTSPHLHLPYPHLTSTPPSPHLHPTSIPSHPISPSPHLHLTSTPLPPHLQPTFTPSHFHPTPPHLHPTPDSVHTDRSNITAQPDIPSCRISACDKGSS